MTRRSFVASIPALILTKGSRPVDQLDYQATVQAILDAGGNATVTFNGPPSLTTRRLASLVVSTTPTTPRPSVTVYRSSVAPGRRIGATRLGDSDTLQNDGEILSSGEPLILVVAGGAPGALFTANAFGTDLRA